MVTYTKWYTPEEIELVANALSLRDRCIFLCSVETGYRISSVLSITANADHIKRGFVEETFSKTGRLHQAQISPYLQRCLAQSTSPFVEELRVLCREVQHDGIIDDSQSSYDEVDADGICVRFCCQCNNQLIFAVNEKTVCPATNLIKIAAAYVPLRQFFKWIESALRERWFVSL